MKEILLPKNSFISGSFINLDLTEEILQKFKLMPKEDGVVYHGENRIINKKEKDSFDCFLEGELLKKYFDELNKSLKKYLITYPDMNEVGKFGNVEDVVLQHYKPGGGFKVWHCENDFIGSNKKINQRYLVFMTYLNDVADGGTEFKQQELYVPAIKGLTLIWPAWPTHYHKGVITKKFDKYIVTGWLSFVDLIS